MMSLAPFTAYIRVVPQRGPQSDTPDDGVIVSRKGGRFDYIRSLEKLSRLAYEALEDAAAVNGLSLALPGSGQQDLIGMFGQLQNGCASRPQFGNSPAQLMIEGFYEVTTTADTVQPAPSSMVISGGRFWSGYSGQKPWLGTSGNPTSTVEGEVSALKTIINDALADVVDDTGESLSLYKLIYKNITWGNGGHHFPR